MDGGDVAMDQIDAAERAGVAVYAPPPLGKDGQPVTASHTPGTTAWRRRRRIPTDEAKEIYKLRVPTSERPNAEFQERLGLRSFAVRGLQRVRCAGAVDRLSVQHNPLRRNRQPPSAQKILSLAPRGGR